MKSLKKNFVYNLINNVTSVLFPLITAPYVARVLEPEGLGLFNFASGYAAYFGVFAALGTYSYATREISKVRDTLEGMSKIISELMSIKMATCFITSVFFIASIFVLPKLYANWVLFIIAGISIYLGPIQVEWYFAGKEDFKFLTTRSLIIRVLTVASVFLFVKSRSDLIIFMALNVLYSIGGNIWGFWVMRKDGVRITLSYKNTTKHLRPLMILFMSSIAISIYTVLDTLMLGFLSGYSEVGYYTSASNISKTILGVVTSLSAVAMPRMSYYFKNKDYENINDLMAKSLSLISFLAFPISIGLICIAPTFVPLFYGAEFMGTIVPLMIMSGVIIAISINNLFGFQVLISMSHDKESMTAVFVGALVNFTLNLFIIPRFGAVGASITSLFAEFVIVGVTLYYVRKKTQVKFGRGAKDLWISFGASLTFVPIAYLLSMLLSGWWLVGVTVGVCVIVYYIIQRSVKGMGYTLLSPYVSKILRIKV